MKRLIVVAGLMVACVAAAQQAKPLRFSEETFDFGTIMEEDGPVTHTFVLTNSSNRPVNILSVKPSCGCTTPEWTREPIMPGKTGIIKAQYDPKDRPGFFHKSLTVTTDYDSQPITLYIKGQVQSRSGSTYSEYPAISGSWRLRSLAINLGKVYRKDEWTPRSVEFVNAGEKPVTFTGKTESPEWIQLDVQPRTLQPGQRGEIKIKYNGLKRGLYGFQSDKIVIHTDDDHLPVKDFTLYVTLEDYFVPLPPEELAKAPQLRFPLYLFDFGSVNGSNRTLTREITFTNTGKSDLEIRNVQGNCSCVQVSVDKTLLKPNENGLLTISFTPEDRRGLQNKAVTVYSNDPQNPVQRITFTATVN